MFPIEPSMAMDRLEIALLRASLADPGILSQEREAALRWALGLARLTTVSGVPVAEGLKKFREELASTLSPLVREGSVDLEGAALLAPVLADRAMAARSRLLGGHPIDPEELDREIREKRLVLALGGGGGSAWVHLGALALLEEEGIRPHLVSGASMGAVIGLFRARSVAYDQGELLHAVRGLSFPKIFRAISTSSRFGLPAALRLHLRGAFSPFLQRGDGSPFSFRDLPIPTVVTISGIRRGALPRPVSFYESLLQRNLFAGPWALGKRLRRLADVMKELSNPQTLVPVRVGGPDWTRDLHPVDMVGFSCAVPGVIHYDVLDRNPEVEGLLERLLGEHDVAWLVDGGLTDNVPAKAAWDAVQEGAIGTTNAMILALDCFSPRMPTGLSSAIWRPLQRIAAENVQRNLEYAHAVVSYSRTHSTTDILPSISGLIRAIDMGRSQLTHLMPLIRKLTSPLPPLQAVAPAHVKLAV